MLDRKKLFSQLNKENNLPEPGDYPDQGLPPVGDDLPGGESYRDYQDSTIVDEILAKKLDTDGLTRMKAVEITTKFLKGRPVKPGQIDELFKTFYNQLKNGTTTRQELGEGSVR